MKNRFLGTFLSEYSSRWQKKLSAGLSIMVSASVACLGSVGYSAHSVHTRNAGAAVNTTATFVVGPGPGVGGSPIISASPTVRAPFPSGSSECGPRQRDFGLLKEMRGDATAMRFGRTGVAALTVIQGVSGPAAGSGGSGCGACGGPSGGPSSPGGSGASCGSQPPIGVPTATCLPGGKALPIDPGFTNFQILSGVEGTFGTGGFAGEIDSTIEIDNGYCLVTQTGRGVQFAGEDTNGDNIFDDVGRYAKSLVYDPIAQKVTLTEYSGNVYTFSQGATPGEFFQTKSQNLGGKYTTVTRDPFTDKITSYTDNEGNSASFTYTGSNATSVSVTIDGSTNNYAMTYSGNMLTSISENGHNVLQLSSAYDPVSNTTQTTRTDRSGQVRIISRSVESFYNTAGQIQSQVGQVIRRVQDGSGATMRYTIVGNGPHDTWYMNAFGAQQQKIDANSVTIKPAVSYSLTIGGLGYTTVNSVVYASQTATASFSGPGDPDRVYAQRWETIEDLNGRIATYTEDGDGSVTGITFASATNNIVMNSDKQPLTNSDSNGTIRQRVYTAGVLTSDTTNGITRTYTHNSDGRVTGISGGNQDDTFVYVPGTSRIQEQLRAAASSSATHPKESRTYDSKGRVASTTTHKAGTSSTRNFVYDSLDRLIEEQWNGYTKQYTYYVAAGGVETNLISQMKDEMGNVTEYFYDSVGRLIKTIKGRVFDTDLTVAGNTTDSNVANHDVTEYLNFIAGSNTPTVVKQNGQKTETEYDHRGRVVKVTRHTSSGKSQESTTVYGDDNQVLYKTGFNGCRTWYGRSVTTGQVLRVVKEFVPESGLSLTDNASVMGVSRDTSDDAKYAVEDAFYDTRNRMYQSVDPMGLVTKHDFNSNNQQIRTIVGFGTPLAIITEQDYDANGNISETRNARYFDASDTNGHNKDKTTFAYDDAGRQTSVTRATGTPLASTTQTVFHYDGRVDETIDPLGKITKRLYDSCCELSTATKNPLGHGSIVNQDALRRTYHSATVSDVSSHTNFKNPINAKTYSETTVRYDALGRTVGQTTWAVALGQVDPDSVPLAGLDGASSSDGITSQTIYDPNLFDNHGLSASGGFNISIPDGGGSLPLSVGPALAQLALPEASGGAGISFSTDAPGSAVVTVNHDGSVVGISISDGAGRTVLSGRLKGINDANPSDLLTWNCLSYDHTAIVTGYGTCKENHAIDMDGNVAKVRIDCGSRTKQQIDVLGNSVARTYHKANDNAVKIVDALGKFTTTDFDVLGRSTSQTDQVSVTTYQTYDDAGAVLTQTDGKSKNSTNEYDVLGRRIKLTDRIGGITTSAYDLASRLTSIEDAEGGITSYDYDDIGQKIEETHPDHVSGASAGTSSYGIVEFEYDPAGRMFRKTDQLGDTITFNFNMLGQLTSRDYRLAGNSPNGTIADTDSFTFNSLGQPLTAESGRFTNTVSFTYDNFSRQGTESLAISGKTYTTTVSYDSRSRAYKLTYPDSSTVEKTFTDRGQLHLTKYNGTTLDTRSYDNAGRLTSSAYNNGVTNTFAYHDDGLVSSIAAAVVGTYSYTYDANKNKTGESITGTMSPYGFTTPTSTGYDDADRLKNWNRTDGNQDQSWNLSLVGDWNSFTEEGSTVTRNHNDVHETTKVGSTNLTHDVKGNLTKNTNGHTYTWTQDNLLAGANTDGVAGNDVTFQYDAYGRRVKKDSTVFVLKGWKVIAEVTSGSSTLNEKYAYGRYVDEIVAKIGTGGIIYYHRNQQASICALTDSSGVTVERYAYDSHGKLVIKNVTGGTLSTTAYANHYTYTGRRFDSESNLYYFRARYFDSKLGRFIRRDPLGFVDGPNLYQGYFAPGGVDPTGLYDDWYWPWQREASWDPITTLDTWAGRRSGRRSRRGRFSLGRRRRDRTSDEPTTFGFDKQGSEVLQHWLGGSGITFRRYGGEWGEYMTRNKKLRRQLQAKLLADCKARRKSGPVNLTFSAEIENGFSTGYEMLHGTNAHVGGFQITGEAIVSKDSSGNIVVKYTPLLYTWNDIIDPNPKYIKDTIASTILHGVYDPKDYVIKIQWEEAATCVIPCDGKGINKLSGYPFEKKGN